MGTSKGYIAPTTPHWSTAKRAVTAFINNRDFDSKAKAASKYATAMKKDMSTGGSFQSAAAGVLGFAQKVASGGIDNALREYHREDLIGKSSEVVWTELLHEFTNYGASVEDNMAADALSQAMENLEIEDIADIGNVSVDILLKEMLKEYDGINERKQYTLCMTNSPGVYISCKRIYPETKYLKFALGFHPQDVSLKDADFYDFMQLVNTTNYVGEIGLDFSRQSYISSNKQCMYFEQIVRACAEKDKLMSVHLRRAEEEAISILKKYRPRRCIIHWFNGNGEQLQQLVDIGCYFSLNSNMVTNENNKEKLYLIPKTRVLIESDGPFTKIDGKKYTFNNLIKIYELVARYYNEPDIIKMVYANFRDILSK